MLLRLRWVGKLREALVEQARNDTQIPAPIANQKRNLLLRRRLEDESGGAAPRFATPSSSVLRGYGPSTVPLFSHCSARGPRRDRVAGRGGQDIYTLSFSSPKTTHALRGAVLTAPQRSETEDPEADPRHGRRVDGTFDEDGPHGGPFLLERANQIFYSLQEVAFKARSATPSS